jgi:hypothetical protein
MTSRERHNIYVKRAIREIVYMANSQTSQMNVIVESLLVGVAALNFPDDPRKQALLIQEISDAAQERAAKATP